MDELHNFNEYMHKEIMYKLYVPHKAVKGNRLPLVVMLHGCKQDPDQFAKETKMNQLAEKEHFMVLYPEMDTWFSSPFDDPNQVNIDGCWNWFLDINQHRGEGLPERLVEIIYDTEKSLKDDYSLYVDWNKVYAAGLSAGGAMACILGVTYPDIFSGIAVCSGLPYDAANTTLWQEPWARTSQYVMKNGVLDPFECGNKAFEEMNKTFQKTGDKRKMPVIVFHGISDSDVHPVNGEQVIIQWAQTNFRIGGGHGNAKLTPTAVKADVVKNGRSYTKHVYQENNQVTLMESWLIHGMGHAWSGGSKNGKYTDSLGPDATSIIWDFFKKTSIP